MKTVAVASLLFVFLFNQVAGAAGICQDLFLNGKAEQSQTQYPVVVYQKPEIKILIQTKSPRVRMTTVSDEGLKSRLVIEEQPLSQDADQAVLEVMRLLLNNNDFVLNEKNVLEKNEMTLGIPLKDGLTFLVTYESRSSERSSFVIDDKIVLATPTSNHKITSNLKDPVNLRLAKSEFDMPDFFQKDTVINLKVPLSLNSNVLAKLKKFAALFEHMDKDELRKILALESPFKRNALLRLGRIKSTFKNIVQKQPIKLAFNGAAMALITFGVNHFMTNQSNIDVFQHLNSKPAAVVDVATTTASFSVEESLAKAQYATIRKEAQQKALSQKVSDSVSETKDLIASGGTSFTVNAHTFIFEQADPLNGSTHTYIVFAEDKVIGKAKAQALQYFAMEINAAKYAPMIKAIKAHQQIN